MLAASYHPAIGTVSGWLTLLALLVVGYYVSRGQGGAALSILREANQVLAGRVKTLEADKAHYVERISELEATRSLEEVIKQVASLVEGQRVRADDRLQVMMAEVQTNERRAQERHEALLDMVSATAREIVAGLHRVADASR